MKLVVDKESLVSVADAIRTKGGTSESLEFPQGFVDAVGAIESGVGTEDSTLEYMTLKNGNLFREAVFPENYHCFLRVKGHKDEIVFNRAFQDSNVSKVTIKYDVVPNILKLSVMFSRCKNLTEVTFENGTIVPYWMDTAFEFCSIEKINGTIDGSKCVTFADAFKECHKLQKIYFVSETIKISIAIPSPVLSAESIQSIIDGLAYVESSKNLTLSNKIVLTDNQKQVINAKGWTLIQ